MTLLSEFEGKGQMPVGAFTRWEFPSFDPVHSKVSPSSLSLSPVSESAPSPLVLPTAAELEVIHQQAELEGHRQGYQIGYDAGYAEGRNKVTEVVAQLAATLDSLTKQLHEVDQKVVEDLLALSLEVARQMVRQALQVRPELILPVIREALQMLPHFNQVAHLTLNPADAVLVRENLGEHLSHSGWKILEDATLERGGCRLDTAHSQIDASLTYRWQNVVATLGQEFDWLEGNGP
ncbi:MAG: flagellar assembly protein FliH [Ferrovum myxofaciens]|uniref:flagellar assembly protein FliH n=1 Tax=Ferrovum myxofaciens TaxID=416213 RepID=UPI0023562F39|nr:flagellar assembly protein FliH [Ferrovum myxofaciens]QKE41096.1 MAG: flagellar assembly protein FliH [Ferrovum myxofaciens]